MKKLMSRTAQYPLYAEFAFNFNDWVVDATSGSKVTFGSTVALSTDPAETGLLGAVANTGIVFDAIALPAGAVITGGELIVETAYAGSTAATISIGTAASTTAFASTVDVKTAGRTALTMTTTNAMLANAVTANNVRITVAYTVANATAGRVRVRVQYTIDGRANEQQIT
jgi:NAD/NADP transhydrogenase alpha subunit